MRSRVHLCTQKKRLGHLNHSLARVAVLQEMFDKCPFPNTDQKILLGRELKMSYMQKNVIYVLLIVAKGVWALSAPGRCRPLVQAKTCRGVFHSVMRKKHSQYCLHTWSPLGAVSIMLTVMISHKTFNGFQRHVNKRQFDSMQGLCVYMKTQLVSYLHGENLTALVEETQRLCLHCHDYDSYDDLCRSSADLMYLCCSQNCPAHPVNWYSHGWPLRKQRFQPSTSFLSQYIYLRV